jgi:hypothetical protein
MDDFPFVHHRTRHNVRLLQEMGYIHIFLIAPLATKTLDESPAMQLASETGILDLEIRGEDLRDEQVRFLDHE